METIQEKRETLRLLMVEHQNKARELRKEIDKIDMEADLIGLEKRKAMIGKCLQDGDMSWVYYRVESLDKDYRYVGTEICEYSAEENQYSIDVNKDFHEESIEKAHEISLQEFEYMVRKALCFIRLTDV